MEKRSMATKITDATPPQEIPKIENAGETFMDWAEKQWALKEIVTIGMRHDNDDTCESCPYSVIREIFVNKINELAKNQAIELQPKL
jgi:hypothetical protein